MPVNVASAKWNALYVDRAAFEATHFFLFFVKRKIRIPSIAIPGNYLVYFNLQYRHHIHTTHIFLTKFSCFIRYRSLVLRI